MNRCATAWTIVVVLALVLVALPPIARAGEKDTAESKASQETKAAETPSKGSPLVQASRRVRGERQDSEVKVYGNEDLEQMFGPPESTAPAKGEPQQTDAAEPPEVTQPGDEPESKQPAEEPDALERMFADEARKTEHAAEVADAERRVAEAKQKIVELEKRLLAVKNPLLARPSAPEEGAEEWKAGDGQTRVRQTEQQIAAARAELGEAERQLSDLRRGP